MSRKQLTILALTGGFIGLVVVFGFFSGGGALPGISAPPGLGGEETTGATEGVMGGTKKFSSDVPLNAAPTTPDIEAPAAQDGAARFGRFNISVSREGYAPATITVKLGNLVQINLTAVGGNYDFSMPWSGLYQMVNSGETKQISFQTTSAGTYVFECRDLCPAGKTISGRLIVLP